MSNKIKITKTEYTNLRNEHLAKKQQRNNFYAGAFHIYRKNNVHGHQTYSHASHNLTSVACETYYNNLGKVSTRLYFKYQ